MSKMEKAKVFFWDDVTHLKTGLNKIFKMIAEETDPEEKIGIKIHFGESDNDTHVTPNDLKDITKFFK